MKQLSSLLSIVGIFLVMGTFNLTAQVKIGNNPSIINPNSILELETSNQGILMPRVVLNDINNPAPLTAPVPEGMIVYSLGGTVLNGYYYWSGTKWINIATQLSNSDRANFVRVKTAADFPAPVGGVITLQAGYTYEINGSISLTNKIDVNGCYVYGLNANEDKLIYMGTAELFTGGNSATIKVLTLAAPVGGKLFNLNDASATKTIVLRDCIIANCVDVGTIKGYSILFSSVINFSGNANGIRYENIDRLMLSDIGWFSNNTGTFETYVGAFSSIIKSGGLMQPMGAAKGMNITGITSITVGAQLKNTAIFGTGTRVQGTFSNKWEVFANGLPTESDEVSAGNIYITGVSPTTIPGVNTPVKINGTTTGTNLFRVSTSGNNRLVYNGVEAKKFSISCSLSFFGANGKNYAFYIAKNGVVLPETKQIRKLSSGGDYSSITVTGVVSMAVGDYMEVWCENLTDASSLTVETLNLSIK